MWDLGFRGNAASLVPSGGGPLKRLFFLRIFPKMPPNEGQSLADNGQIFSLKREEAGLSYSPENVRKEPPRPTEKRKAREASTPRASSKIPGTSLFLARHQVEPQDQDGADDHRDGVMGELSALKRPCKLPERLEGLADAVDGPVDDPSLHIRRDPH